MNDEVFNFQYAGKLCKFTFTDDRYSEGVISNFFPEDDKYYLVLKPKMREFKELLDRDDIEGCKKLCKPIDLSIIISAELIVP